MRFKIDFKLLGEQGPVTFPVNYQSEFSAWIHKILHFQNSDFTSWLAENKFLNSRGEYNLFTFSDVFLGPHKIQDGKILVEGEDAGMVLAFYAPMEIEPFILSIFSDQEFKIGDSRAKTAIRVTNISAIKIPDFQQSQKTKFTCLSPMLITPPNNPNPEVYLSPDQKDFDKVFFKSLMFKYANLVKFAFAGNGNGLSNLNDLQFKLLGKPKPRIIKIRTDSPHQKSVKGFMFDFEMKAPVELLRIGYNAGFGELNNLGFGCCEIKS
jgi:CRISPR-associated endoribonuclease Cas6